MALKSKRIVEVQKFYAPCLVEYNGDVVFVFETGIHSTGQVLRGIVIDGLSEIGTRIDLFPGGANLGCKAFYGDITISQHEH